MVVTTKALAYPEYILCFLATPEQILDSPLKSVLSTEILFASCEGNDKTDSLFTQFKYSGGSKICRRMNKLRKFKSLPTEWSDVQCDVSATQWKVTRTHVPFFFQIKSVLNGMSFKGAFNWNLRPFLVSEISLWEWCSKWNEIWIFLIFIEFKQKVKSNFRA